MISNTFNSKQKKHTKQGLYSARQAITTAAFAAIAAIDAPRRLARRTQTNREYQRRRPNDRAPVLLGVFVIALAVLSIFVFFLFFVVL